MAERWGGGGGEGGMGAGQREGARGSETEEQRWEAGGVTGTDVARGWRESAARRRRETRDGGETRRGY